MAQLLNIHSNPEIQQQLEALNQSISALTEATPQQQDSEPTAPEESLKEAPPAPVVQPSAEQTTPEASSTPADMQNMLAVLLSQLMKTQEPAGNLEENNSDKNSGPQGPRRTPTMPQEEAAGKQTGHESHWAQVLLILLKISNIFFFTSVASVSVFLSPSLQENIAPSDVFLTQLLLFKSQSFLKHLSYTDCFSIFPFPRE